MCVVFTTQYNPVLWYLPVNIQIRIIPGNRPFSFRMIEIITLVLEDDLFAQHTKTMCEATRNKKLTVIVFCQFNRNMFSKCGRTLADIDSHIKNLRRKLEALDAEQSFIRAVDGVGYRWEADACRLA